MKKFYFLINNFLLLLCVFIWLIYIPTKRRTTLQKNNIIAKL
ncbi:MAG: DUF1201 domain-containing protein [Prevotella pallens]|nr:DUF1201 domain-containing protein [Prevotella pallens]